MLADPLEAFQAVDGRLQIWVIHDVQEGSSHGFHLCRFNREIDSFDDSEVDIGWVKATLDSFKQIVPAFLLILIIGPILVLV